MRTQCLLLSRKESSRCAICERTHGSISERNLLNRSKQMPAEVFSSRRTCRELKFNARPPAGHDFPGFKLAESGDGLASKYPPKKPEDRRDLDRDREQDGPTDARRLPTRVWLAHAGPGIPAVARFPCSAHH
jgi:hypothetical protein